jgi:hypothetical protein
MSIRIVSKILARRRGEPDESRADDRRLPCRSIGFRQQGPTGHGRGLDAWNLRRLSCLRQVSAATSQGHRIVAVIVREAAADSKDMKVATNSRHDQYEHTGTICASISAS